MSQHVVVIIGFQPSAQGFELLVNDPFPYPPALDPYLMAGGQMTTVGQYVIDYGAFVNILNYQNSVTF